MQINEILSEKAKKYCFKHKEWKEMEFINHNLGLMRKEEHDELVKIGAIKCKEGVDSIVAEYPYLVIIKSGEEVVLDMFGDLKTILKEKLDNEKKGIKCKVAFSPRKFTEYFEQKRRLRLAEEYENESVDQLIKEHY
jgi:hypothetical protein